MRKVLLIVWMLAGPASVSAQSGPILMDEIVAVVDESIILRSDIMSQIAIEAMRQGISREQLLRDGRANQLFEQILNNMVQDELLIAKAKEDSLEAPADMLSEQVRTRMRELKEQNGAESFAEQLREEGLTEREVRDKLRKNLRKEILRQMMYGRLVRDVTVTTKDVEAFRAKYQDELPPYYSLSHIMIAPKPSESRTEEARARIEKLLEAVKRGEDFVELARTHSEDPGSAPYGGDLGFFGRGMMVPEVEEAAFSMRPGEVSDIIESEFGYHILRVEEKDGDRVRARHILISVKPSESDAAAAYQEAVKVYERLQNGEKFEDLVKEVSDHEESIGNGGKIGTYMKDQPPPGFSDTLAGMGLGDISTPVQTEFGWHIVRIDDSTDALEELVKQSKIQETFDKVLAEVRAKLYVDIRI